MVLWCPALQKRTVDISEFGGGGDYFQCAGGWEIFPGGFSLNVVLPVRQNYNMLEGNRIENMAEKQAQDEVA